MQGGRPLTGWGGEGVPSIRPSEWFVMSLFSFDQIYECCIICLCGEAGMVMSGVCSVYIRSLSTALVSREK